MIQTQVTNRILKASGMAFQPIGKLQRRYGIEATAQALAHIAALGAKRMRIFRKEARDIGFA